MPRWIFVNQNKEGHNSCCYGDQQRVEESFHCWFHHIAPRLSWADPACIPHPNTHPPLNGINWHYSEKRRQRDRRLVCTNTCHTFLLSIIRTRTRTHTHTHTQRDIQKANLPNRQMGSSIWIQLGAVLSSAPSTKTMKTAHVSIVRLTWYF